MTQFLKILLTLASASFALTFIAARVLGIGWYYGVVAGVLLTVALFWKDLVSAYALMRKIEKTWTEDQIPWDEVSQWAKDCVRWQYLAGLMLPASGILWFALALAITLLRYPDSDWLWKETLAFVLVLGLWFSGFGYVSYRIEARNVEGEGEEECQKRLAAYRRAVRLWNPLVAPFRLVYLAVLFGWRFLRFVIADWRVSVTVFGAAGFFAGWQVNEPVVPTLWGISIGLLLWFVSPHRRRT